jgi:hypothetical protein
MEANSQVIYSRVFFFFATLQKILMIRSVDILCIKKMKQNGFERRSVHPGLPNAGYDTFFRRVDLKSA